MNQVKGQKECCRESLIDYYNDNAAAIVLFVLFLFLLRSVAIVLQ